MKLHANVLGSGDPFLILHGFLGMGDNWKTLGGLIAEEGYEVHLIDQRNHGRSFHDAAFSYSLMVEDIKRYCDANSLQDIILLGHSMGGKTAMLFATTYPERVSKLLVADIAPRKYPQHHQVILEGLTALSQSTEALTSRSKADAFLAQYISALGVRQFLLKNLYWKSKGKLGLRMNLEALNAHIEEVGAPLPSGQRYDGPTLFLKGGNSDYITDTDAMMITSAFAKAEIVTIPKAGHWLHAENPQLFLKHVLNFL